MAADKPPCPVVTDGNQQYGQLKVDPDWDDQTLVYQSVHAQGLIPNSKGRWQAEYFTISAATGSPSRKRLLESNEAEVVLSSTNKKPRIHEGFPGFHQVIASPLKNGQRHFIREPVGPSLQTYFTYKKLSFSLITLCIIAGQGIHRIQKMHSKNVTHGKISPTAFRGGYSDREAGVIYLVDFNHGRVWNQAAHDPARTAMDRFPLPNHLYAPVSWHNSLTYAPIDDIESLFYVLLHFASEKSGLPWATMNEADALAIKTGPVHALVANVKDGPAKVLLTDFITEIRKGSSSDWRAKPAYGRLRREFAKEVSKSSGMGTDLDWHVKAKRPDLLRDHPLEILKAAATAPMQELQSYMAAQTDTASWNGLIRDDHGVGGSGGDGGDGGGDGKAADEADEAAKSDEASEAAEAAEANEAEEPGGSEESEKSEELERSKESEESKVDDAKKADKVEEAGSGQGSNDRGNDTQSEPPFGSNSPEDELELVWPEGLTPDAFIGVTPKP